NSGRELYEGGRHDQHEGEGEWPADAEGGTTGGAQRYRESSDAPGQDANNRERYGEVLESPHAPGKLLRITHAVQYFDIVMVVRIVLVTHAQAISPLNFHGVGVSA